MEAAGRCVQLLSLRGMYLDAWRHLPVSVWVSGLSSVVPCERAVLAWLQRVTASAAMTHWLVLESGA